MARTARNTELQPAPDLNENAIAADLRNIDAVIVAEQQQHSAVRLVAAQIGYQLPADCTDPDLIQRDISMNMRRSIEACLEVGKGLLVLKEACQHGAFMARLEVLGIEPSVARRFMQSAAKFSKRAAPHVLEAAGNQSKLFELLILDDDQVEELELTGQTGGLTLDDISKMGFRELRKECRSLREKIDSLERLNDDKNRKIDELVVQKSAVSPVEEKVGTFKAEIAAGFDVLETTISQLYLVHGAILKEDVKWGDSDEAERLILRQFATLFGDRLNRSAQQLAELCDTYEATLAGWAAELDGRALNPSSGADASGDEA